MFKKLFKFLHRFSLPKIRIEIVSIIFGLAILSFFFGVLVMEYQIPPYHLLRKAKTASIELLNWFDLINRNAKNEHPNKVTVERNRLVSTAGVGHRRDDEVIFTAMFREDRFGLFLLDSNGQIIYRWKIPEAVFSRAVSNERYKIGHDHMGPAGAHLFPNGDVVFNICWRALVLLDKDSSVVWYLDETAHHRIFVDKDSNIFVCDRKLVEDEKEALPHMEVPYYDEGIICVSREGEVQGRISVLDAIYEGKYQGILLQGHELHPKTTQADVMHLNDVEILGEAFCKHHPFANPGDIGVSLRTVDALAIIDKDSKKVKWSMCGPFLRQHDPDFLDDGTILIFDNREDTGIVNEINYVTEPQSFGYSRIIQIDPCTMTVLWCYEGTTENPFYTSIEGEQQLLSDQNVLVVETEKGRIFEVDRRSKAIVWEYTNVLEQNEHQITIGRVTVAQAYSRRQLRFLD
jgi:hypothetical protein